MYGSLCRSSPDVLIYVLVLRRLSYIFGMGMLCWMGSVLAVLYPGTTLAVPYYAPFACDMSHSCVDSAYSTQRPTGDPLKHRAGDDAQGRGFAVHRSHPAGWPPRLLRCLRLPLASGPRGLLSESPSGMVAQDVIDAEWLPRLRSISLGVDV